MCITLSAYQKPDTLFCVSYTISQTVNTKALYDAGLLLANCNDLRIGYGSGSQAELDRSIQYANGATNCSDSTATIVHFKTQASLTNGSSDSNYYMYYNYSSASAPSNTINAFSPTGVPATFIAPFNGTTTALHSAGTGTASTATGAIRYSGGKSAINFDGSNDTVVVADANNLDNASQMTWEGWVYPTSFTNNPGIFCKRTATDNQESYCIFFLSNGKLTVDIDGSGDRFSSTTTFSTNQWYYIAVVYDGTLTAANRVRAYINGTLDKTGSETSSSIPNGTSALTISGNVGAFSGYMDELRISNSVRYSSNFTPSTSPFVRDANSMLLFHFDENGDDPRNTGKAIDDSGNGNHGTITGAKYVAGVVGVDASTSDTGYQSTGAYAGHQGVFIEEGTTNLITNPSFENSTYNTNWGLNYMNYATASATFTPNMAKRNSAGPFAAGVMPQGNYDATGTPDVLSASRGTQINGSFYSDLDTNQGTISFWVTPEWNGNDGLIHTFFNDSSDSIKVYKDSSNNLVFFNNGAVVFVNGPSLSSWTAGTTYHVAVSWDFKNTLSGSNYVRFSVNGVHTFAGTSAMTASAPGSNLRIGVHSGSDIRPANAIIEGLTVYRRPLYEATTPSGINAGNGDEISGIYNSGTGKDPTLITGSWDVVFALPTNASTGSLTTGTGNAWSHPHASNLLYTSTTNTGGFMMNGTYTSDGWTADNNGGSAITVSALSSGNKIFSGGYSVASNGTANQGIYYDKTVTSSDNWVVRGVVHSDGTCVPRIVLYNQTGSAEIGHLDGTTSSTRTAPNVLLFTGKAQTSETTLRVKLVNTASTGTCSWHQVEIQSNLLANPSFESGSGDPWIPTSWNNSGGLTSGQASQESTTVHSGSTSWKLNSADNSGFKTIYQNVSLTTGKYYTQGGFAYWVSGRTMQGNEYTTNHQPLQTDASTGNSQSMQASVGVSAWTNYNGVIRSHDGGTQAQMVGFFNSTRIGVGYADDLYQFTLTDVSLTVTPASSANSTEASGLRVDGADTLTQSVSGLSANSGVIKFKYTPRHSFSAADLFGSTNPVIASASASTNNDYISLFKSSSTNLRLQGKFNGTTVNADYASATLNAGTTYTFEISYAAGGSLTLKINGTQQATATGVVAFGNVPTTIYFGYDGLANWYDGTVTSFVALTPSQNSTAPYYKFGSNSAKLTATTDYPDQYTTSTSLPSNGIYTLSAYVYNGTTSAIGGTIDNTVAQLASGSAALTTTYTDMGGGWWRLSNTSGTQPAGSYNYGVETKAGKTVYMDGVQVENKSYFTSYTDGSLGTGYAWTGTSNASTSTRTAVDLQYATASNINASAGTVSFWFKPDAVDIAYAAASGAIGFFKSNIVNIAYVSCQWQNLYYGDSSQRNIAGGCGTLTTADRWYLATFTWSNGAQTFYLNTTSRGTGTYNSGAAFSGNFELGKTTYWTHRQFGGSISDLRIYSSALSSTQVSDLYNSGLVSHAEGSQGPVYQASKTYESATIDATYLANWTNLGWTQTTPSGVGGSPIQWRFAVKSADSGWSDSDFLGSDCTSGTYWSDASSPYSVDLSGCNALGNASKQYARYRIYLSTADQTVAPSVDTTTVTYAAALPNAPSSFSGTAASTTSITWSWTDNATNENGFYVMDNSNNIVCTVASANTTTCTETGLTPNTSYTRKVVAYNAAGNSTASSTSNAATYSIAPTVSNVTANQSTSTWSNNSSFVFTNTLGFGAGTVEYYRYVWDTSSTHSWTGSETQWTSSTLSKTATSDSNSWYLHVQGYNSSNVSNGNLNIGPFYYDATAPTTPGSPSTTTPTGSSSQTWSWSAATDALSGILHYAWRVLNSVNAVVDSGTTTSTSVITNLGSGVYTFFVKTVDNASNSSSESSGSVTVNTSPPSGSISINNGAAYTKTQTVTLSLTATDDTDSSLQLQMKISEDSNFAGVSYESFAASKSFTLSSSNGTKTIYLKLKDSTGNESSLYSAMIVYDTVAPTGLEQTWPSDNSYINTERPVFQWKAAADSTSGLSKYVVEVDNGDENDFSIDNIPASRISDLEMDKYKLHYENFGDNDPNNNYISVYTKSSSGWGSDKNDGKIKEGKRTWTVKAVDNAGNEASSSRDILADFTNPTLEVSKLNDFVIASSAKQSLGVSTNDTQPRISGKITDPLASSISSGPKTIEVEIKKKNNFGIYETYSTSTVHITDMYFVNGGTKVEDNTLQTSSKYSSFSYTPSLSLPYGIYEFNIHATDIAGNTGPSQTLLLTISPLSTLVSPEEKAKLDEHLDTSIEKEIDKQYSDQTKEVKEKLKDEMKKDLEKDITVTKPSVSTGPSVAERITTTLITHARNAYWTIVDGIKLMGGGTLKIIGTVGGSIESTTTHTVKVVWTGVTTVINGIAYTGEQVIIITGNTVAHISNAISHSYFSLAQQAPGVTKTILVSIGNGTKMVVNTSGSALRSVSTGISFIVSSTSHTGTNIVKSIGKTFSHSTSPITKTIAGTIGSIANKLESTADIWFDKNPTRISGVRVIESGKNYIVIYWKTNHNATSKVNYGTSYDYGKDVQSNERVKEHKIKITGLEPGKTYYYEVMSQGKNYVFDARHEFKMPKK